MKKNTHKVKKLLAFCLSMVLLAVCSLSAFAASVSEATVDLEKMTSLTLYKYDMTGAQKDGAWDSESYVSTGIYDAAVNHALDQYAIKGVVFTYLKVADLERVQISGQEGVMNAYAFSLKNEKEKTEKLLKVLGLSAAEACENSDADTLYFESDVLIKALEKALGDNPTDVKTSLEDYISQEGGTQMNETDEQGMSKAENLEQGLYLLVETSVPENVTDTTDPFFVSLPMTDTEGNSWIYDVTVYPKNETGAPDLEKTVREAAADTGKNEGEDEVDDGYAHHATASAGDQVEYQIISTLPVITSKATGLSAYTFEDVLSKGIRYNDEKDGGKDLNISFYKDKECTEKVTSWDMESGKFKVEYSDYSKETGSSMTITMTDAGLAEINSSDAVYDSTSKFRGYSELTMRITYKATLNEDATLVYGSKANPNDVTLTWKRSNRNYYDQLEDDCHVYSYGISLIKKFSDDQGDFSKVDFIINNASDDYYVQADLNEETGIYYVSGHTEEEAEATVFHPMSTGENKGKIFVKGLEDDVYVITETATDKGYTLLKEDINVTITVSDAEEICSVCGENGKIAAASVNGEAVSMSKDGDSSAAIAELTVTNTKGFTLPRTGENGTLLFSFISVIALFAGAVLLLGRRRKDETKKSR